MTRFVMLAAFLVACGSKTDSGPPCDKVVDHMVGLIKKAFPKEESTISSDRAKLIAQCEQRKMSPKVRTCMVDATEFAQLASCEGKPRDMSRTPQPRREPTPLPPGHPQVLEPSKPPPAPMGSAAPAPAPAPPAAGSGG